MEETNFLQNIYSVLVLMFENPLYFQIFMFFILIFFLINIFMFKKNSELKKVSLIIYLILILLLFGYYGSFLIDTFDELVDFVFDVVYFPNAVIYFIMLFFVNVKLVFSIFDIYSKMQFIASGIIFVINVLNVFCFCFINLLLFLILDVVISNNLDFFSQVSLYSNETFTVLIQTSMISFVVSIIMNLILILYSKLSCTKK